MQTFKLKYPIEFGQEVITELEITRPKAKHIKGIANIDSTDGMLVVISRITGKPPKVIDDLDFEDLQGISEIIQNFTGAGLQTGE